MRMSGKVNRERQEPDVLKGVVAGLIGGLVAAWTMNQFQSLWSKMSEGDDKRNKKASGGGGKAAKHQQETSQSESDNSEDATVKVAEAISTNVFGHELTAQEKKTAGPAVHYTFGATMGGLYGAGVELAPDIINAGAGLPFGAILFLGADEAAVPALGLSKSPTEVPWSNHAYALTSHFIYGATTELVRRAVRRVL